MDNIDLGQKNKNIFECLICQFKSLKKNHYNRHLETEKHKKRIISNNNLCENGQKGYFKEKFSCECGKIYKHKPNLYAHKKKCEYNNKHIVTQEEENINYKEKIEELVNKNKELENTISQQNQKIIDLYEKFFELHK
jgi:predicted RNase H-like nuclease (RuvC/YqgF family)